MASRTGTNWKELRVLSECLRLWGDLVRGKLVLVRMDSATAVAYANRGANRLACAIKERVKRPGCTATALPIKGRRNTAADALSRFSLGATGDDPRPDQGLPGLFRDRVEATCGHLDVDKVARGDSSNA